MKEDHYIGIDVGGTKICAGLVAATGTIIKRVKIPTPRAKTDVLNALLKLIDGIRREIPSITGVGIGIPGIVDAAHRRVVITPNLALSGIALADVLEKNISIPVSLGNDVNLGLLGEHWLGSARTKRNIIGLFPGTGLGGAIIVNGELVEGANGAAAELGHVIVVPDGPQCTCGNRGCLEALVGRWAIERDIRTAVKQGKKTLLPKLVGGKLKQIKSGVLAEGWRRKDPLVEFLLKRMAQRLGSACVSLRHIFDPELIVFGGGIIEACAPALLPTINAVIQADPLFAKIPGCPAVASLLGDDAVMLGAVALAQRNAGRQPEPNGHYPCLTLSPRGVVTVDEKVCSKDFYVRADGKVKKRSDRFLREPHRINQEEVEKLCRKNPELLIIGVQKTHPCALTPQSLTLLTRRNIETVTLPLARAVSLFGDSVQRRALFVQLNAAVPTAPTRSAAPVRGTGRLSGNRS